MAPYITTLSPGLKPVTPAPAAAISPEASAPTTSGSLRLAKAMPRKPHRARWLIATALMRICTSPSPGGGGAGTSASSSLRSAISRKERMADYARAALRRRLAPHHQRDVLPAETERIRNGVRHLRVARLVGHHIERDGRIRNVVIDGGRNALVLQREQRDHRLDRAGRRQRMTDHGFVGGDRHALHALAEHGGDAEILHLVVFRRAGAVRVDVCLLYTSP